MTRITFAPYIPLALWLTLVLAVVALLAWYAYAGRRRVPGRRWWAILSLMTIAAAIPLLVLLNPTWLEQIPPPPGKPLLTILLDRSASMSTRDAEAENGQTRYEAAVSLATATALELGNQYEVRTRTFAAESTPAALDKLQKDPPAGTATDLATAIHDALEDDRPQGQAVLLLSDGAHNHGPLESIDTNAVKAKAIAAPVYVKTLGGPAKVRDLEVLLQQPQALAFVGQTVPVTATVRQRGSLGAAALLTLIQDGKQVETRRITLKADDTVEETIHLSHKKNGLYRYELRAEALPGEVTTINNTTPLLVRVIDQPVRVLLLEGKPYWDTKFLVRTLSHDPSIELTSVVQLAEGRLLQRTLPRKLSTENSERTKAAAAGTKETTESKEQWTVETDAGKYLSDANALASYQVVILGRNAEVFLSDDSLARLRKWIAEGEGSLLCFRGAPASQISQRLGQLMPVRWTPTAESRFHMEMTGAGQSLRWLPSSSDGHSLSQLPSLATTARPESLKSLAVVLAKATTGNSNQTNPVIVYQPVGNGRVVVVEGAGMWRWAFMPPDHQKQESTYGVLWHSLVRWLVSNVGLLPSQRWALRADKLTFGTDENAAATLLVRDWAGNPPQLELAGAALGAPKHFTAVPRGTSPGQYYASLGRLLEGRYTLRLLGIDANDFSGTTAFNVRGNLTERLDIAAQPGLMKRIAMQSGGAVLDGVEPRLLAQQFDQHLSRTRPERIARTTAWDRWWVLLGAIGIWATAWSLRRRSGLV